MNKIYVDVPSLGLMERVNKNTARNLYYQGYRIVVTPYKMRLDGPWSRPYLLRSENPKTEDLNMFDRIIRNFEFYNCNSELGRYAAYYVDM